jgi:hypothetical protein
MTAHKTEFLNMRVAPATKRKLRLIAARENRSMANALEWLVAGYFANNNVEIHRQTKQAPARAG